MDIGLDWILDWIGYWIGFIEEYMHMTRTASRSDPLSPLFFAFALSPSSLSLPFPFFATAATLKLEKVGQVNHFDNELTGGDISRDGSEVLLRSYTSVYHFCRGTGEALEDVLSWEFGEILPYEAEEQGESVAFAPNKNDGYYTLSESSGERWVPLYHYRRREIS